VRYWLILLLLGLDVPAGFAEEGELPRINCPLVAKICPDGSHVVRVGPYCEFAPCSDLPTSYGAMNSVTAAHIGLSKYADGSLGMMPLDLQPVGNIIWHRSALHRKKLTVRGVVVRTLPDRRLVIADTASKDRDRKMDVMVRLPEGDRTVYKEGETVDIPATVWGDRIGVMLEKN